MGHRRKLDLCRLLFIFLVFSICSSQDYYLDENYHKHILQREDQLEDLDYDDNVTLSNQQLDNFMHALTFVGSLRKNSSDEEAATGLKEALDAMSLAESNSNSSRRLGVAQTPMNQQSAMMSLKNILLMHELKNNVLQKLSNAVFRPGQEMKWMLRKFGDECDPLSPNPCKDGAYVRCMETKGVNIHGKQLYTCACDFLHTQVGPQPGKPACMKNVWTQCSGKLIQLCLHNQLYHRAACLAQLVLSEMVTHTIYFLFNTCFQKGTRGMNVGKIWNACRMP